MAHTLSQKKHIRRSEERRQHNVSRRSKMRTFLKKTAAALDTAQSLEQVRESYRTVQAILDRYATKGLIHKNKAARHKSYFSLKIKALEAAALL